MSILIYSVAFLACSPTIFAIWPAPTTFHNGSQVLWLAQDFQVVYSGGNDTNFNSQGSAARSFSSRSIVQSAIVRAKRALFEQNLVPWKLVPRNELSRFEPPVGAPSKKYIEILSIIQNKPDTTGTFKPLAGQVDESYHIVIDAEGNADIYANSSTGILRALETFVQLFYQHSSGKDIYTMLAPVEIRDAPKFPHRGLNMDVSRNWFPVDTILRAIDALSWNKFNRLHLHMTDSQSWPLDIPSLPALSREGAYQTGLSYSPSDFQKIQTFAIERGVEVIVELDMPGHTTSIGHSYPDLITAFNAKPWDMFCAEPPCGSLKLNSSAVYRFLDTLFMDVLPRVQSYTAYFHTGGDEVNMNTYLLDDTVGSNDFRILRPLIQAFVDRNHNQIRAAGLTPIVWEEMALDWNLTLGKDVVVQAWLSDSSVAQIADKGHKVLAGNYNFWYLDCGKGQWLNIDNGASFQKHFPFNDYCSPAKNWRLVYSYDPLSGIPAEKTHLVLGGEVHMWAEQTDPINFDDMVWPRASAAGEVLWSGRQDAKGENRSQIEAAPRLAEMRERMVNRGVRVGPVQMVFCTQSDGSECAL